MAVTINQSAPTYVTAWNPIQYQFSSTQTAQPGFRFIVKIRNIGGAAVTLATISVPALPGKTYGFIDISKHIGSNLSAYINPTQVDNAAFLQTGSWLKFEITVQDWYSGALQGSATTSSASWTWLSALSFYDWMQNSKSAAAWVMTSGTQMAFLSRYPNGYAYSASINAGLNYYPIARDETVPLTFNVHPTSPPDKLRITSFNSSFAQMDTVTTNIPTGANILTYQFGVDPAFLNGILDTVGAKYLKFEVLATATVSSEMRVFEIIDDDCSRFEEYKIYFLNDLGGFEYWKFAKRSVKTVEIEKSYYNQSSVTIGATTVTDSLLTSGPKQYYGATKDVYTLNSDLLTAGQSEFLLQLAKSPMVFWRRPSLQRVKIEGLEKYEIGNANDGRVFALTFKMVIDTQDMIIGV